MILQELVFIVNFIEIGRLFPAISSCSFRISYFRIKNKIKFTFLVIGNQRFGDRLTDSFKKNKTKMLKLLELI